MYREMSYLCTDSSSLITNGQCSICIQDTDVGDIFLQEIGSADIGFQDPLSWQYMGGKYDVRKVWLFVRKL